MVVADHGYISNLEVLACEEIGITAVLPKPLTFGANADERRRDFTDQPTRRC